MMNKIHQNIIENYISAYNKFDIEGMTKNLSVDVIFENISNGNVNLRTEGILEFRKQAESAKQFFTQRKQTIKIWKFENTKVIIDIFYRAILANDLPNGLKKGDILELEGQSEFEFEHDKIKVITDKS